MNTIDFYLAHGLLPGEKSTDRDLNNPQTFHPRKGGDTKRQGHGGISSSFSSSIMTILFPTQAGEKTGRREDKKKGLVSILNHMQRHSQPSIESVALFSSVPPED
jgi:hypothetical protein